VLLGYALAFLALITSASSLMVHSFDKFNSWPLFLFWQALGGLLAASLGKNYCQYLLGGFRKINWTSC
jgi:hypothetical protein